MRDFLLGRPSKDHDIATSARPDEICELFPRSITVGKAFGVIKVPVEEGVLLEIATFREDLAYEDHRHPLAIAFSSPIEDALRRDFTINAFFYDSKGTRILDMVNGMEDLRARKIRAIGDPSLRFHEDALRLLRAVRFASVLGFEIEPVTEEAIIARSKLVRKVSPERIRDELTLMWKGPRPEIALELLARLGLLSRVLPELDALRTSGVVMGAAGGDPWKQTLKCVELLVKHSSERSMELAWAGVLAEVGRVAGPARDTSQVVRSIGERLKMSNDEIQRIVALVEEQSKFKDVFQMREATLQRFIRQPGFSDALLLQRAIATAQDGNLMPYQVCAVRYQELKSQPTMDTKIITGEDLIQLGFRPGPTFSEILRSVEDLVLENKLASKEQALEYVVTHFVR